MNIWLTSLFRIVKLEKQLKYHGVSKVIEVYFGFTLWYHILSVNIENYLETININTLYYYKCTGPTRGWGSEARILEPISPS